MLTGRIETLPRSGRRRPFSSLIKKLASLKHGSSSHDDTNGAKRNATQIKSAAKKGASRTNNPYPESSIQVNGNGAEGDPRRVSLNSVPTTIEGSLPRNSVRLSEDGHPPPTIGNKSTAATCSTDMAHSEAANSHAHSSGDATTGTAGAGRGVDSTFSSPAPSVRSLATTLTTIQSAVPGTATSPSMTTPPTNLNVQFSHQFPASTPPLALPSHLAPQPATPGGGHPHTYTTATANNILTDNASILTLASSSKRRRRRSMDTDASVRALAPSSLFGGSRESLPLSVLSASVDTTGLHGRPSMQLPNERASIYSSTGVAPALTSDRNSYYASKAIDTKTDGGSVKSGYLGHGRNDSVTGSIGLIGAGSPLASPAIREPTAPSRRSSGWGVDGPGGDDDGTERTSTDGRASTDGRDSILDPTTESKLDAGETRSANSKIAESPTTDKDAAKP